MGYKRESHNVQPLLLSSEDKGNGFSIVADNRHNITLSKWSKPVAWVFSSIERRDIEGIRSAGERL